MMMRWSQTLLVLAATATVLVQARLLMAEPPLTGKPETRRVSPDAVVINDIAVADVRSVSRVDGLPGFDQGQRESYSGFIQADAKHDGNLFFWFFEAKTKKPDTPVILWLQGGPGCSSMMGNLLENGPFHVDKSTLKLVPNPGSWNDEYHMLFVDQPFGAGFSFTGDKEGYTTNEDQVAEYFYNGLTTFFLKFPDYLKGGLYITGESYAGKMIPAIALYIHEQNQQQPEVSINLKGIAIGDGLTDPEHQTHYSDYAYNLGMIDWKQREQLMKYEAQTAADTAAGNWDAAFEDWYRVLNGITSEAGGVNVYDIRLFHPYDDSVLLKFLNSKETREMLHVGDHEFDECNAYAFRQMQQDFMQSVKDRVVALLEHYPVMLYNGELDLIIATPSALEWIRAMEWPGQQEFLKADRTLWHTNGEMSGYVRKVRNLTQVNILLAGHLVPQDQPLAARDMIDRFIKNKPWH